MSTLSEQALKQNITEEKILEQITGIASTVKVFGNGQTIGVTQNTPVTRIKTIKNKEMNY